MVRSLLADPLAWTIWIVLGLSTLISIRRFIRAEGVVREWAARCGLEVLEIQEKWFVLAPFVPTRYTPAYRLRVRSSDGLERTAWLRIRRKWYGAPCDRDPEVMWQQGPDRFTRA